MIPPFFHCPFLFVFTPICHHVSWTVRTVEFYNYEFGYLKKIVHMYLQYILKIETGLLSGYVINERLWHSLKKDFKEKEFIILAVCIPLNGSGKT